MMKLANNLKITNSAVFYHYIKQLSIHIAENSKKSLNAMPNCTKYEHLFCLCVQAPFQLCYDCDNMPTLGVLTTSDLGSRGIRIDSSGTIIMDVFSSKGFVVEKYEVVPDERHVIEEVLRTWVDTENLDLIVTTGGTGLTKRDVTPEATLAIIDREVPGIAEAMRIRTMDITPFAALSRSVAGVRQDTLIINMPGSPKAVQECLEVLMPVIPHALGLLKDPPISHES